MALRLTVCTGRLGSLHGLVHALGLHMLGVMPRAAGAVLSSSRTARGAAGRAGEGGNGGGMRGERDNRRWRLSLRSESTDPRLEDRAAPKWRSSRVAPGGHLDTSHLHKIFFTNKARLLVK